jgi:hypothetical protein
MNAGGTLTNASFGYTITVTSGSSQTVHLPAGATGDIGGWFSFIKLGAGSLIIAAQGSDIISDSGSPSATLTDAVVGETYATVTLQLVTATKWAITGGDGSWTTAP